MFIECWLNEEGLAASEWGRKPLLCLDLKSTPGGIRTPNPRFRRLKAQNRNDQHDLELRQTAECVVPTMVPSPQETESDPDLARLNAAWATLPAPIRTAILALLDAAGPTSQRGTTNV